MYPSLYQVNTRVWLRHLADQRGHPVTLDDVPDAELDRWVEQGMQWIWLLSVWRTGQASRRVSLSRPEWRREMEQVLPDLVDDDIPGSGFAITEYRVSEGLGGDASLAGLRSRLHQRGLKLMLDFVPNHTALDHCWIDEHPEYYITPSPQQLAAAPQNYCQVATQFGLRWFAHGRDPYFDGWPDTLQLNYANRQLRSAMIQELVGISSHCDGVRCDMAMLLEPDVFSRTWGLETESFWPQAISRVRRAEQDFLFLGEVYWDREWDLQQQGFDVTYDKRLYDRLGHGDANSVRAHLQADLEFQNRSARFLENHDEPRAALTFEPGQHRAAAIVTYLAPGMRFFHQGQLEGFRHRISPHLGRGPAEPVDRELADFYALLLQTVGQEAFRHGHWRLARCTEAWPGNGTHENFLAFSWQFDEQRWLVVVNYAHHQGQCFLRLDWDNLAGRRWQLADRMSSALYHRDGDELVETGLFLDLPAWGYHVFELKG